ncbi:MAG: homoserine O-acetyltransferase [Dehalococcoidia bacterium]
MKEDGSVGIVKTEYFTFAEPPNEMELESGQRLGPITLAFETYGRLNDAKDNAVLVFHALSGDAHAAGYNSEEETSPGWWDIMIGPGKGFDTRKYFVICSNIIGGCKGSTGPISTNPKTGRPYALSFPVVTVKDMVNAQKQLLDFLGIERLLCVVGGSLGGMQVLQWVASYPETVRLAIPIASTARLSTQAIALDEVGRAAIKSDPGWLDGEYYGKTVPHHGLSVARMIGHISYLSEPSMHRKFGRRLQDRAELGYDLGSDFEVEAYLRHKGDHFVARFDANSYLYISKAMDYFDLGQSCGSLTRAFSDVKTRFLVISFSSDWLFPSHQSKEIVRALRQNDVDAVYMEIRTDYGHDAFLLESDQLSTIISNFLANA